MIGTFTREEQRESSAAAAARERERERENKGERQACALREQRTCLVRRTCKHERTNEFLSSSSPNASLFHYCVHIFIQQAYYWGGCLPIIVYIMWTSWPSFFGGVGWVGGWLVGWGTYKNLASPPPPKKGKKN